MINYSKNNRVKLRNFSESQDFSDIIKTLLVRMLRRKHRDITKCAIYTEFNSENPNESYPDIELILNPYLNKRKRIPEKYIFEIQKEINENWLIEVGNRYEEHNLIIIPIKILEEKYKSLIEDLKRELEKYII